MIVVAWALMWGRAHRLRPPLLRLGVGARIAGYLLISWRDLASAAAALGLLACLELWRGWSGITRPLAVIGLGGVALGRIAVLSALLFTTCYAINLGFSLVRHSVGARPKAASVNMVPATAAEALVFCLVLAPASGVGEEIVFRGVLQWAFTAMTADPLSAVLSQAVLFGSLHLYQGGFGVLRNIAIGIVLGFGTQEAGSLIPAIVAHTLINAVVATGRVRSSASASNG